MENQRNLTLVTGGTGLLGSHLLYKLVQNHDKIRAIKRKNSNLEEVKQVFSWYSNHPNDLFSRIEWVNADMLIPESLDEPFLNVEKVYHSAAFVSFDPRDYQKLILNNQEGTANIVDACLKSGVKKLLHVSSTAALGSSNSGGEVTEEMIWSPDKANTGYSVSKFRSEMEVWRGMEEGLNAVIVNPSIIFGPGFWEKGSSSMFKNIKKKLAYYPKGETGFVGVWDVVQSMISLMESDIAGERFIINSENLTYKDVFSMIAKSLSAPEPSKELSPLIGGIAWRLDAIRSLFGFRRVITREAVAAGQNTTKFSNEKIMTATGIEFQPVKEVINQVASFYPR